MEHKELPEYVI
jgi:very-short-patch-repair endonuclease